MEAGACPVRLLLLFFDSLKTSYVREEEQREEGDGGEARLAEEAGKTHKKKKWAEEARKNFIKSTQSNATHRKP